MLKHQSLRSLPAAARHLQPPLLNSNYVTTRGADRLGARARKLSMERELLHQCTVSET